MYLVHGSVNRFYSLDMSRGVAAIGVVFWHWKHFFYSPGNPLVIDAEKFPLYGYFFAFYSKGWLAVDLFFTLSGFIFYWLYSGTVYTKGISLERFALLRFSRLYPLHFVTLCIVAISQFWLINKTGFYYIYQINDGYHFILNLFLASSWGFEDGYSFNGPSWSISVEVLLYFFFFFCARKLKVRVQILFIISLTGFLVHDNPIGRGIGCFFMGGTVFWVYKKVIDSRLAGFITHIMFAFLVLAWVLSLFVIKSRYNVALLLVGQNQVLLKYYELIDWFVNKVFILWPIIVLFPLTILSLALVETSRGSLGRRFSIIGDISYSCYMLHFPIQLLTYVFLAGFDGDKSIFYSAWFMVGYFCVLLAVSIASYKLLEMPSQKYLRNKLG